MRIIDWISDVCSSDLRRVGFFRCARPRLDKWLVVQLVEDDAFLADVREEVLPLADGLVHLSPAVHDEADRRLNFPVMQEVIHRLVPVGLVLAELPVVHDDQQVERSEEHTSELQSLMRISYAVSCLKQKK